MYGNQYDQMKLLSKTQCSQFLYVLIANCLNYPKENGILK